MNKSLFLMVVAMTGCYHAQENAPVTSKPVDTINTITSTKVVVQPPSQIIEVTYPEQDGFDATGKVVASSSRAVWNASKQAYEYVTSDEMKDRAVKAWQSTKKTMAATAETIQQKLNK